MSEPKPITEWGDDEVKAMFGNLPDGALIVKRGDQLTVANAEIVTLTTEDDTDYFAWPNRLFATKRRGRLEAELKEDDKGNWIVTRTLTSKRDEMLAIAKNPGKHSAQDVKIALEWLIGSGHTVTDA